MGFANKTGLGCGAGTPLKRRMRALVLAVCLLALAGIIALGAGLVAIAAPDTISEEMSGRAVQTMIKEYVQ